MPQEDAVNLAPLFQSATHSLAANRDALNAADADNHDHGDNMVHNFQVITAALEEKRDAPPAEALAFAGERLAAEPNGSAQLYARNLSHVAGELGDSPLTRDNALAKDWLDTALFRSANEEVLERLPDEVRVAVENFQVARRELGELNYQPRVARTDVAG